MTTYYDILNISKTANADEIKHAFRVLAMKYHPDKNPNNKAAEDMFKKVNEAYSVLSDPQKRKSYDHGTFGSFSENKEYSYSTDSSEEYDIFGSDIFNSAWWKEWKRNRNSSDKKKYKISKAEAVKTIIRGLLLIILGLLLIRTVIFVGLLGFILAFTLISEGILSVRKGYKAIIT